MRPRRHALTWTLAAVPYLLLSASQQAGIITVVDSDGSGERCVYARTATGRAPEVARQLAVALPDADLQRSTAEAEGQRSLAWRDARVCDLSRVGEVEVANFDVVQAPLSLFTRHTWKETVSFDRGEATDVEVSGQSQAELHYVVVMPGRVTASSPPGKVSGNKVEWSVRVSSRPQAFTAESQSLRWPYLVVWAYLLAFVISKGVGYAPRVAGRLRRKPRRI